jgi:modification methylase
MCGVGTTLVEAAALGRRAVEVELEPRWADLARANLTHALPSDQARLAEVRQGDARQLTCLLAEVAERVVLVVTSPPYACDAGVLTSRPGGPAAPCAPATASTTRPTPRTWAGPRPAWHRVMAEVLAGCAQLLRPGGCRSPPPRIVAAKVA